MPPAAAFSRPGPAGGFGRNEDGGGTIFALFGCLVCLLLAGAAIDTTNAWRNQELLYLTADVAAHAGVSALAQGRSASAARAAAITAIEFNMPQARYGPIIANGPRDIVLRHYDAGTNRLTVSGAPNAVVVGLERSRAVDNPVPTFLIKLAGVMSWDIRVQSVATLVQTQNCNANDGIYARDRVTLSSQNQIGAGFCIHSQDAVWLPQNNTFAPGSYVSMPDLADCRNKCTDLANPGVRALEVNMIMPDLDAFIQDVFDVFTDDAITDPRETEFFRTKTLAADLSALDHVGISSAGLQKGSVVTLSPATFARMEEYPSGLIYHVRCDGKGKGNNLKVNIWGNGYGPTLKDVALMTDCPIHFDQMADVRGSLIVTTSERNSATLTADRGAVVGDPNQTCIADMRSVVMAKGKLSVPADFAISNVTFIIGEDVDIAASSAASTIISKGLSIHASGRVIIAASHTLKSCGNAPGTLIPELKVIRYVIPE